MKNLLIGLLVIFTACANSKEGQNTAANISMNQTFHQFNILALNLKDTIHFSSFEGKKVLLVNVASECGFTYQYEGLQKLQERYADQLIVLGLPCNQFGKQEPGTEEEIADFCNSNYGVTFPLTQKIDVKGENQHPIYQWLTQKEHNGLGDYEVNWNFNKFLIDEKGNLQGYFKSKVKPMSDELIAAIEK